MPNTVISLKKSSTPSTVPTNLANGELAINYADGKLFYKNTAGYIAQISGAGGNSFGTVNANNVLVVADGSGSIVTLQNGNNIVIVGDAINDKITISVKDSPVFNGDVSASRLISTNSVGDEGGEIVLATAQTNNNLSTSVTVDIYQNKLRFFETGGTNRGAFIDLSIAGTGVSSNLLSGGGGTAVDSTARTTAGSAFDKANTANITADIAFGNANQAFAKANTANITADRAWNHANAAFANANTVMITAQSAFTQANIAFANANTVMVSAQAAFTVANSSFLHANSAYAFANSVSSTANAAFVAANTVLVGNTNAGVYTLRSTRKAINLIPGNNIAINVDDDSAGDRANVTITAVGGSGGSANIAILDEGVYLTNTVSSINFTGTGVTATASLNDVTVNITGGGGSGISLAEARKTVSLRL